MGSVQGPRDERVEAVRLLLFEERHGTLSTISTRPEGHPFGSIVPFAQAAGGQPLLLLSALAQHTRNLQADGRACLLVAQGGAEDPLQAPRAALIGRAACLGGAEAEDGRARFLKRHPRAAAYFALDFGLWRLDVAEVRFVGGFAKAAWVSAAELLGPGAGHS
ncbi:MAG TPA: pyridoxamine 5'-phosphate oxidase family protein [Anaeromyxobacteraceae bacterium]|jgi:putative heme iron utilization protein